MTHPRDDQGFETAADELAVLPPLRELADELRAYPVRLLALLCRLYEERGGPVPDHALKLPPYLGETALRGLVEGRYAERVPDPSFAIAAYAPTEQGRALAARVGTAPSTSRRRRRA